MERAWDRNDLATAKATPGYGIHGLMEMERTDSFLASDGVYDQMGRAGSHPNYIGRKEDCYDNGGHWKRACAHARKEMVCRENEYQFR